LAEPLNFRARNALVTGAGSGIGRAIAREFARQGLDVAANDIDAAACTTTLSACTPGRAVAVIADVTDAAGLRAAIAPLESAWGGVDVVVSNAGFGQYAPFEDISAEQFERMLAVHLKGAFNLIQAVLPGMKTRGFGRIIVMASVAGLTGTPTHVHYSMVKGGLIALTKALAKEVAARGITVNALAPGMIETPFLDATSDQVKDIYRQRTPLGRVGQPDDVAGVCAFLASTAADYLTGQVISPNGGYLI